MKFIKLLYLFIIFLFFGCFYNNKNSKGIHYVNGYQYLVDINLQMDDIYNVLRNNFSEFSIQLNSVTEGSPGLLYFNWNISCALYFDYINMHSENYFISIGYFNDDNGIMEGIYLQYNLKGKDKYKRKDEYEKYKEPMEKIKKCLINNFSNVLEENNFYEIIFPIIPFIDLEYK